MIKITRIILMLFAFSILLSSCESTDLDLQDNPLALTPDSADPDFILNGILLTGATQHIGLSGITDPIMRHANQFGTYTNTLQGVSPTTMNGAWSSTYSIMTNLELLKSISENSNLPHHVGMAQIINAFALTNLVDYLGTATFSEAVQPDLFPAPGLDSGVSIYEAMYGLLDEAILNLHKDAAYTHEDGFYSGDLSKWEKLANSLIIRMYVQSRKSSTFNAAEATQKINDIVNSGMYIKEVGDDYQIVFGTNDNNPDVRHPFFQTNYISSPNVYLSNDFIQRLLFDKSIRDPRMQHYFYRQSNFGPNATVFSENFINDCITQGLSNNDCYLGFGYWGRTHADDSGVSNDNLLRATFGAYPGGGAFDTGILVKDNFPKNEEGTVAFDTYGPAGDGILDDYDTILGAPNLGGAGIHPVISSFLMNSLLAEAVLFIPGVTGDASTLLSQTIQDSFTKVTDLTGQSIDPNDITTYVDEVINNFNTAASNEEKLAIIINESYIASFGNSVDAYNSYRRTGYPKFDNVANFQNPGTFPRSMFLPKSELDSNDNPDMVQKQITDQVFWDTNPPNFID